MGAADDRVPDRQALGYRDPGRRALDHRAKTESMLKEQTIAQT